MIFSALLLNFSVLFFTYHQHQNVVDINFTQSDKIIRMNRKRSCYR